MKNQNGKEVWVARDVGEYSKMYNVINRKRQPKPNGVGLYKGDYAMCWKKFEAITGFKLNPGDCKRVRIKIEECK